MRRICLLLSTSIQSSFRNVFMYDHRAMEWFRWVGDPNAWVSLVTLTFLEIVLGIDNVIFISILAGKLPATQQAKTRTIGLALALITRILPLPSIKWLWDLPNRWESFSPILSAGEI